MKLVAVLALTTAMVFSSTTAQTPEYKRVCYFPNWAIYREGVGQYWVDKLDPFECTHLIYAFAVLNNVTYEMVAYDPEVDINRGGYATFVGLKRQNPALKTLLALGGWNDSQFTTQYSEMVTDPALRANFVAKAVQFISQYGFDGLDFDWEYPGDPGLPSDKANLITLFRELREAFQPHGWLLAMAAGCSIVRAETSYDIQGLAETLDFVSLMAYDIHGAWEDEVDHHSPLFRRPWDGPDSVAIIDDVVDHWLAEGMPNDKLIFGVPLYGRSFNLENSLQTTPKSPAVGAGNKGRHTRQDGSLAFYEICELQQEGWATVTDESGAMGPYSYGFYNNTHDWVGWDDIDMIVKKVQYAMNKNLGGIMAWDLSTDDFNNLCGFGPRPIMKAIKDTLEAGISEGIRCSSQSEGQYFADPADCQKFYKCVNGIVLSASCASGYAFSNEVQGCVLASEVPGCS